LKGLKVLGVFMLHLLGAAALGTSLSVSGIANSYPIALC